MITNKIDTSSNKIYFVYCTINTKINLKKNELIKALYSNIEKAIQFAISWHLSLETDKESISVITCHNEGGLLDINSISNISHIYLYTYTNIITKTSPNSITKKDWSKYLINTDCGRNCLIS